MLSFIVSCIANTQINENRFIVTVPEGHDVNHVAAEITRRGNAIDGWSCTVEKTHSMIGILIVQGPPGSCQDLLTVNGIKDCEPDSIVTIQ